MQADQVTDVVHSNAMFPTGGPTQNGFAILCSDEAVAGCKKPAGRQSSIEHAPLSDEARADVTSLLEHSQFEVPFGELRSVVVQRAHELRPGAIIIRTATAEHKIGFAGKLARITGGGPDPDEVQDAIATMIERHAPGKVQHPT
jgi:hypothetical protein